MSAAAVAVAFLILAAAVAWGCIVDWIRHTDERHARDNDRDDHQRALMREVRRHTNDDDIRWRP